MEDHSTEATPSTPEAKALEGLDGLEAAEAADDESRLKVLEDLYRSLESGLEGSGNPSSQ